MKHFLDKLGMPSVNLTIKYWIEANEKRRIKDKLPNIIYLNQNGWKSSIQLRTMFAMVKQTNTNTKKIMAMFYELFSAVYG